MTHATNATIEEQLASKFYALIHRSQRTDFRPYSSIGHGEREPWLQMAREALRVAEWNRTEPNDIEELSLPKPDWQP